VVGGIFLKRERRKEETKEAKLEVSVRADIESALKEEQFF